MNPEVLERRLAQLAHVDLLTGSRRGLEKESLRVTPDAYLSRRTHPGGLGSALMHPYITTDFSEALLEFVTPALEDLRLNIQFLCDLHHFTSMQIGEELLWAFSMPCRIREERDIRLARYGDSNLGRMKTVYRRGLGYRYGRFMQAIAGLHYNYSLPLSFWPEYREALQSDADAGRLRSRAYMGLVRNLRRVGWLLIYLFGASPAVCRGFVGGRLDWLEPLGADTLYAPHATSLRMSDIGYHNTRQARLQVSANSLDDYVRDLQRATRTENPVYRRIGVEVDGVYRQLNANELQIDDEFYGTIRPKRVALPGERPTTALTRAGVEYVELRLLDLNPEEPVGINQRQARFVEVFLLYCLLSDSPAISGDEISVNQRNQSQVARRGREPGLVLRRDGGSVRMIDWGREIVRDMLAVCELLDSGESSPYGNAVREVALSLEDSALTPSARQLRQLRDSGDSLLAHALEVSRRHTEYFQSLDPETNAHWDLLMRESRTSADRQKALEAADDSDFVGFVQGFYS